MEKQIRKYVERKTRILSEEEKNRIIKEYKEIFNNDMKIIPTFSGVFSDLVRKKGITGDDFEENVGVTSRTFEKYKLSNDKPGMKTMVAFAIVYDVDISVLEQLLQLAGCGFNMTNPVDYAYHFLVRYCRNMKIVDCNNILLEMGIDENNLLKIPINEEI